MIRYRLQNYDIENKEQTKKLYCNNNYSNIFFLPKNPTKILSGKKELSFLRLTYLPSSNGEIKIIMVVNLD
jgi:hypothetical protein